MNNSSDIAGKYRHYKGNEYEVLGEGTHTETQERYVVYKALYAPYALWIRPYEMFFETVTVNNEQVARFTKYEA